MDNIYLCELCLEAIEPKEITPGARMLPTFNGYTVDGRLHEFRNVNSQPIQFIPFASPKGRKLLAQMHVEAVQQARNKLADLEKRLQLSYEKLLQRHKQEEVTWQCSCTTEEEHEQHTVICDHCDVRADEGEITEIEGKWTCDACYSKLYL